MNLYVWRWLWVRICVCFHSVCLECGLELNFHHSQRERDSIPDIGAVCMAQIIFHRFSFFWHFLPTLGYAVHLIAKFPNFFRLMCISGDCLFADRKYIRNCVYIFVTCPTFFASRPEYTRLLAIININRMPYQPVAAENIYFFSVAETFCLDHFKEWFE